MSRNKCNEEKGENRWKTRDIFFGCESVCDVVLPVLVAIVRIGQENKKSRSTFP